MDSQWPLAIIMIISSYLVGAVPFGVIFVRWSTHQDVRLIGSGNIGATNVRRAAGTPVALAVLLCDMLKGAVPVALTGWIINPSGHGSWVIPATALAAVLGHMFPAYLKFRASGKGVATTLGAFLMLAPPAGLSALVVFVIMVTVTRRVSIGSMTGAITLAPAAWLTSAGAATLVVGIVIAALIVIRHKENIQRLRRGSEPALRRRC